MGWNDYFWEKEGRERGERGGGGMIYIVSKITVTVL
jgi:hypothetical protein